jgi:hypothetical protein
MRPIKPGDTSTTTAAMTSSTTMLFFTEASPGGELRDDASMAPRESRNYVWNSRASVTTIAAFDLPALAPGLAKTRDYSWLRR